MTKKSITTRRGDGGQTTLYSGEHVSKGELRMAVVGDIDELVSVLGVVRAMMEEGESKDWIRVLQETLFLAGAQVATSPERGLPQSIDQSHVTLLDQWVEKVEARLPAPPGFALPGADPVAAHMDWARTIARRCERGLVVLVEQQLIRSGDMIPWFNRLSDGLWLMAREQEKGATDWKS